MKNHSIAVLSMVAIGIVAIAAAVPTKISERSQRNYDNHQLLFVDKFLTQLKDLSVRVGQLEGLMSNAVQGDHNKRQQQWDQDKRQQQWEVMDYGWGGGRFGKRAPPMGQAAPKRYDMYGNYGRFGRDVDHVDADGQ